MGFLFVGLGGAFGAMLRYTISLLPYRGNFPLLTLLTNLVGALAIGFIAGIAAKKNTSKNLLLFLKTGVCGGFTTFSTFSLEAYTLLKTGSILPTILYVALSMVLCIGGVFTGMLLSEKICT